MSYLCTVRAITERICIIAKFLPGQLYGPIIHVSREERRARKTDLWRMEEKPPYSELILPASSISLGRIRLAGQSCVGLPYG